ncbi:hypothetical protein E1B28_010799 [Marasmius oreades]|uniref:tRNA (cytosine(38)-C(5))-methyltransferase n=1 Tax=Marasmius oreades TaxID=181124 RepID=A0A9P7UPJ9_9AGAR|nr:uncharacterized protein E1B28_010799 [Marasmius oreades]KAG7089090.1 hypothetical protein E1B28_010799 [Marasmius oreades]
MIVVEVQGGTGSAATLTSTTTASMVGDENLKALEFYSGIGGLHLALSRSSVNASIESAFDWDQNACKVYEANHGRGVVERVNISTLTATKLARYEAEMWLLSPSCQPYTVLNPNAKGDLDPRAKSFLHLIQNVLPEMAQTKSHPSYLLVENVAGFETSSTHSILLETLRRIGYHTAEFLLTPLQFGVPNSRLRYYLLARKSVPFSCSEEVQSSIPGLPEVHVPEIGYYLDEPELVSEGEGESWHPHAVPDRVLKKWGRLFDIVLPSSRRTCCFTRGYTQLVERAGSIIQMNESLDTTTTFDSFLAIDDQDEAIKILYPLKLRYFSPTELLRLFAFEDDGFHFIWPRDISRKTKYRLIGNSVNVRVVKELIEYLCHATNLLCNTTVV